MFKRKYRLPAQIKLNHPRSLVSDSFVLKYTRSNFPFSRFGFVVSKKIDKRAVKRNQVKRRYRSYLEANKMRISPGYDILFILRQNSKDKTWQELQQEMHDTLEKTKLLV